MVLPNRLVNPRPMYSNLIANFLHFWSSYCRQVKLQKGVFLSKSDIKVGIPRGGFLSALLFTNLHLWDTLWLNCNVIKLCRRYCRSLHYYYCKTLIGEIQTYYCISRIVTLCEQKKLLLNPKKSKGIWFENKYEAQRFNESLKYGGLISQGLCVELTVPLTLCI